MQVSALRRDFQPPLQAKCWLNPAIQLLPPRGGAAPHRAKCRQALPAFCSEQCIQCAILRACPHRCGHMPAVLLAYVGSSAGILPAKARARPQLRAWTQYPATMRASPSRNDACRGPNSPGREMCRRRSARVQILLQQKSLHALRPIVLRDGCSPRAFPHHSLNSLSRWHLAMLCFAFFISYWHI